MARNLSLVLTLVGVCATGLAFSCLTMPAHAVAWRWPIYCFFERGAIDLADRCHLVLRETVNSWHREQEGKQYKSDAIDPADPYAPPYKARVRVVGYAPDAPNGRAADRLSLRRAAAIAQELEQLGIPEDLISVVGEGNKLRIAPDAPTDPANRLVQIILY